MDSSLTYTTEPMACNSTMSNSGEHVIKRWKKEGKSLRVGASLQPSISNVSTAIKKVTQQ